VHVPHGDIARAKEVARLTAEAGLAVASYGSYYYAGESRPEDFPAVLDTAAAMGAPLIRIWAGKRASSQADADYRGLVAAEAVRIAGLAAARGVAIAFEFHSGTLNDSADSSRRFLEAVERPNVSTYWQPPIDMTPDDCLAGLAASLDRLSNLHVYHWQGMKRLALEEGQDRWRRYLAAVSQTGRSHWALLEFVAGDDPANLAPDAAALRRMLEIPHAEPEPAGSEPACPSMKPGVSSPNAS
jgi:sugar phosphate isomerase/epimerase